MRHVFIVGSKSLGAYGGYETFVNKLTECHQDLEIIKYHVACKANGDGCMDETKLEGAVSVSENEFIYHNAHCFKIHVPPIGPAGAIYYDVAALNYCCKYIKENGIKNPIVYVLACRIGPFAGHYKRKIHALGGELYVNPDGHEWMRAKWPLPVRKYWKISEHMMVKHADLLVCDSKNIEKYIQKEYKKYQPKTIFIAYGADMSRSILADADEKLQNWYREKGLKEKEYYLVVGRFVPENNYETMIREFMKTDTKKDFAIITNLEKNKFYERLRKTTGFENDKRIKFVGTVYDQELLKKIRENAFAYFHGHEVGGTNPSLIEALSSTELNILLNVGFNKEVGEEGAIYFEKEEGALKKVLETVEQMSKEEREKFSQIANARVKQYYSWQYIASEYEELFIGKEKDK